MAVVFPMPGFGVLDGLQIVWHRDAQPAVKVLRIQSLPPLALAIGLGERRGVVGHSRERAFDIVTVGGLEPVPGVRGVVADAEAQAVGAGNLRPGADNVLLGADVDGVPGLVLRVVGVEIVVVIGERDKVFRAGPLVEGHQFLRLPFLGLPEVVELHETELRGVAIVRHVVGVIRRALNIHVPRIPVALFRNALG